MGEKRKNTIHLTLALKNGIFSFTLASLLFFVVVNVAHVYIRIVQIEVVWKWFTGLGRANQFCPLCLTKVHLFCGYLLDGPSLRGLIEDLTHPEANMHSEQAVSPAALMKGTDIANDLSFHPEVHFCHHLQNVQLPSWTVNLWHGRQPSF